MFYNPFYITINFCPFCWPTKTLPFQATTPTTSNSDVVSFRLNPYSAAQHTANTAPKKKLLILSFILIIISSFPPNLIDSVVIVLFDTLVSFQELVTLIVGACLWFSNGLGCVSLLHQHCAFIPLFPSYSMKARSS